MTGKQFKMIGITLVAAGLSLYLLFPALQGRAAPAPLPSCGHNSISRAPATVSGPPDIARSQDAAGTNTAVVWSEGNSATSPIGSIRLAFSNNATTSRYWGRITVDSSLNNQNPSVVFDPADPNTVHVAYQKATPGAGGNSGIHYARCQLAGGDCDIRAKMLTQGSITLNDANPQIAVIYDGASLVVPAVVFQRSSASGSGSLNLYYTYVQASGAGTVFPATRVTSNPGTWREQNPSAVFSGNRVHVAFVVDTNQDDVQDAVRYLNLAWTVPGGTLNASAQAIFNPNGSYAADPDFPTISALGNTLVLVWEVRTVGQTDINNVVYNRSDNNGAQWFDQTVGPSVFYRYLPSTRTSLEGPAVSGEDDRNSTSSQAEFTKRLRPDVMLYNSGGLNIHVAWHESTGDRLDIMYSYFVDGGQWSGTPVLVNTTPPQQVTNVTWLYGDSVTYVSGGVNYYDNARPRLLYGPPGKRLQLVYLSQTNLAWDVMYNGWQRADAGNGEFILTYDDADCDAVPDTIERVAPPECGDPNTGGWIDTDEHGGGDHYNCNHNYDRLPDLLDTNADGDYMDDYVEWISNPDPNSNHWRVYDEFNGAFMPLILK